LDEEPRVLSAKPTFDASLYEPKWAQEQYDKGLNPVTYWYELRQKYPKLSRFALDILTIPASSCDCERMFSELGDLLEPKRRNMGPQLLAAIQLVRSWVRAGFKPPGAGNDDDVTDEGIKIQYNIRDWDALQH
jgi:hypothetical protein